MRNSSKGNIWRPNYTPFIAPSSHHWIDKQYYIIWYYIVVISYIYNIYIYNYIIHRIFPFSYGICRFLLAQTHSTPPRLKHGKGGGPPLHGSPVACHAPKWIFRVTWGARNVLLWIHGVLYKGTPLENWSLEVNLLSCFINFWQDSPGQPLKIGWNV